MGDNGVEPASLEQETSKNPLEELQCTICLSAQFAQECRVGGCNHSFCFSCISEWVCQSLRPSCPMCRHDVDKILYNFAGHTKEQKEIGIKEYRSSHMSLTPTDRNQLLSERRLVVRNLMHSYKTVGLINSDISDLDESKEADLNSKKSLLEFENMITQHIMKAEITLADLRKELTRKNKSLVFNTLIFRRMIYTNKIKIKYQDQKKPKLQPYDLSKEPDRFRGIVTEFLLSEFDAIPFQAQPKVCGHKWRTKFLGETLDLEKKQQCVTDIYNLMLVSPLGNDYFQKQLNSILMPVSTSHVQFLEDHLEAIVAIEKTSLEEFYNEVYYDSIYNSFSNNFFDYNAMMHMRDDPQSRFEAIFSQIHRDMNPADWLDPYSNRLLRQASNTDGTDRATNNDGDSSRSESPEERVPTPMPDEDHAFARAYFEQILEIPTRAGFTISSEARRELERDRERQRARNAAVTLTDTSTEGETTRTLPYTHQYRSHMTLRSSARRDREITRSSTSDVIPPVENRPMTRRDHERALLDRVRDLENRSLGLSSLFRSTPGNEETSSVRFTALPFPGVMSFTTTVGTSSTPVYNPRPRENEEHNNGSETSRRLAVFAPREQISALEELIARGPRPFGSTRPASNDAEPSTSIETPSRNDESSLSLEQIAAAINQEDADNGLDFISIAHRTRAARRAARNGQPPEAPPAKRVTRRDRH